MLIDLKFAEPAGEDFILHPESNENEILFFFNHESERFSWSIEPETVAAAIRRIEPGIYKSDSFNFEIYIDNLTSYEADSDYDIQMNVETGEKEKVDYGNYDPEFFSRVKNLWGVADNVEQIKKYFAPAIANPHVEFVISVVEIRKDTEPKSGGWRWHKWGEYIGVCHPQCEYLADEPAIESVLCFHGYFVKKQSAKKGFSP